MPVMGSRLTVVSNGHGEDAIGALLSREVRSQRPDLEVRAFPLVGGGRAYHDVGIATLGPCRPMPSGGLMLHSWENLSADLRAGWLSLAATQFRDLARHRAEVLLIVGDLFAQLMAASTWSRARFIYQPLVSVLQADGARPPLHRLAMERFTYPERLLMRHRAHRVYVRDDASAAWLRRHGVHHAVSLGNPAIDVVAGTITERDAESGDRLALLPGSRAHADRALALMLSVVATTDLTAAVAWAMPHPPRPAGWEWRPGDSARGRLGTLVRGSSVVAVFERDVAKALGGAKLALATTGTAAEQAAAAGVPVISFALPPEHTADFLAGQKRLLGEALTVTDPDRDAIVTAAQALLGDEARFRRAAGAGRLRMGGSGGTSAIVSDLLTRAAALGAIRR